jgi:golgin subfamily B member 1
MSGLELGLSSVKEEIDASSRCKVLECDLRPSNENLNHTLTELANPGIIGKIT